MRIRRAQEIEGMPAVKARNLLRAMMQVGGPVTVSYVARVLGVEGLKATEALQRFAQAGLVQRRDLPGWDVGELWEITTDGHRVALASAALPVRRSVAEEAVRGLIDRARAVNSSCDYTYCVAEIRIFGSYLTDVERLGDVDLVICLRPRFSDIDVQWKANQRRVDLAAAHGRRFSSTFQSLIWPQVEVLRFLKRGRRFLSFHDPDDPILPLTRSKVVFEESASNSTLPVCRCQPRNDPPRHLKMDPP